MKRLFFTSVAVMLVYGEGFNRGWLRGRQDLADQAYDLVFGDLLDVDVEAVL